MNQAPPLTHTHAIRSVTRKRLEGRAAASSDAGLGICQRGDGRDGGTRVPPAAVRQLTLDASLIGDTSH
ncbi:hypothetical protein SKAU_G00307860 [Synaphobranchus kaupii]|uniref:Uncharacterized protein n=1 Tax=Synaphobranchus kaupii TaxID=118154 RepID=A0A9Q1ER48_SYNKA|nr:hypothetical protein SKAU_G00307860 [Synaphobranchus kaupii]